MKRLLCLLSGMNVGGAETFLMKIYRTLDKRKYQMDFCINVKEKCFYEDEILGMGGKIYRIPSKSENLKEFKKQLSAIVKEQNYQYVMRITSSAMGFLDLQIAKKAGAKVCIARSSNASDGGALKAYMVHRLGRLLYGKYVDVKIAPSDLAAKYTFGEKSYASGQVHILHNAVDVDLFQYSPEKRTLIRNELGIPEYARVIGHIGRFMAQKNHDFLLDIFSEIRKKDENALLLLVGKGELEEQIRQKVRALDLEASVLFVGVRSDIPDVLSAMDVFVFPSLYEGMPNTIIEAQANGLTCVISDTITREADITGLVSYLPLTVSPAVWAEAAFCDTVRQSQKAAFMEKRYDIYSVVKDFMDMVFQE